MCAQRKEMGAFRVLTDTYVTEDSGTGVVHQAPAFGEVNCTAALRMCLCCEKAMDGVCMESGKLGNETSCREFCICCNSV